MISQRKVVLNAAQLRKYQGKSEKAKVKRSDIYIILDNVLDTYNIGSIFRLADAVAAKKIYLCGGTETPPNHRIKKSSINTTEIVDWEYAESTAELIRKLKIENSKLKIVAIEQTNNSISYNQFGYTFPIALVVGHESFGVSSEVLELCDGVVELPMYGINKSLNVVVSLGIVMYNMTLT